MKNFRILAGALSFIVIVCQAQQFTEPGWFRATNFTTTDPPPLELASESGPTAQGGASSTGPEIAEAVTLEIEALARGLENDPKRIFDYVHDQVAYAHYFGSKKGAQLTLLERSGNDFDQCALLVALLRAAGHTANYRFGLTYMPYETANHRDYRHWIGTTAPNTNWSLARAIGIGINETRGFPFASYLGTNALAFHRVWVVLNWNGRLTRSIRPSKSMSPNRV
jgi:hypothetical protein